MKVIVYEDALGLVVYGAAKREHLSRFLPQVLNMTDDEYLEFLRNKDVPKDAIASLILDDSKLPPREDWEFSFISGDEVKVNAAKKAAKLAKKQAVVAKKKAVLQKLSLNKQDVEALLEVIKDGSDE